MNEQQAKHPKIMQCLALMAVDTGFGLDVVQPSYDLVVNDLQAKGEVDRLDTVEAWLADFDEQGLRTICCGEDISSGDADDVTGELMIAMTDGEEVYTIPGSINEILNDLFEALGAV
jgi:hypothetical protein